MAKKSPYRSFPLRIRKDERFRRLSLEVKGLLLVIALHAELTGLVRFSPRVLAIEANAVSLEQLAELLDELQQEEWIVVDGDAFFIPELLAWSPYYSPANENHRPSVENSVEEILSPKLVEAFWSRYPEWRSGPPPDPARSPENDPRKDGMRDGIGMGCRTHADATRDATASVPDPRTTAGANSNTTTDSNSGKLPTAVEYARALAAQLNVSQAQNRSLTTKIRVVRADAAAATELLSEGVPLAFALEVATEIGIDFRPDPSAEQIVSTRYVNKAIIERWHLAGFNNGVLPLKGTPRRRHFRDENQSAADQASNKNPEVQAKVRAHMARLDGDSPGAGDRWLDQMKAIKPTDRWLFPFALEWINANVAATETDPAHEARRA